jgi:predicted transposase/invertase (TIGR01784 family)
MSDINPRVDIAFKKLFGVEENKDLLISLINSIVGKEDQVADVTLLNPYNLQNFRKDKLSILDVKARGLDGKMFNIEIQISDEGDYSKRALYYWARLYVEQLKNGSEYDSLPRTIGIHILNFVNVPAKKYHNVFHITEKETHAPFFTNFEMHTIELKKFQPDGRIELSDLVAKIKTSLDMWAAFLTRHDLLNKNNLPKKLNDDHLKKAMSVLEVMNFNTEEREVYEGSLHRLRMEASAIKASHAKGLAEGRDRGRAEERQDFIFNMLKQNCPDDLIMTCTKISQEELETYKKLYEAELTKIELLS